MFTKFYGLITFYLDAEKIANYSKYGNQIYTDISPRKACKF